MEKRMLKARLILDAPRDAYENMALDEALFLSAPALPFAATLRIYRWAPHAVSLGRRQRFAAVDMAACRENGIDVVIRPGGGSAVYHGDDITYCFVCRRDLMDTPDAKTWRDIFSGFLAAAGIAPDGPPPCAPGGPAATTCFACAAEDEPTIGGKKFVGSARRRSKTVFLQHGSILLKSQPPLLARLVKNAAHGGSAGLLEIRPTLSAATLETAFIESVKKNLGLSFTPGAFTENEMAAAQKTAPRKRPPSPA